MTKKLKSNRAPKAGQIVSLRSLGEYLDLSPATISMVLNDAPGAAAIPQRTRDRVKAAADKFDYRPSFYARNLRNRQTFSVGVLVPELSDSYTAHVLTGVEDFLLEEGYFYLTASHRRKADLIKEYSRLLMERSVEGFILIDTALQDEFKLPAVAIAGHRRIHGVTNVVLNQKHAAELVLQHLVQLGHREIAFMRGGSHSSDADDRWNCLKAAAENFGLKAKPELTVQLSLRVSTPELGLAPTNELLDRGVHFTALVCYDDLAAIGAIRALRDHGLRVPEDISVVGFDDIQSAAFNNPSITTIRQPLHQMGMIAARLLLQRVRAQGTVPRTFSVQPELIVRESTSRPADTAKDSKPNKVALI